MRNLVALQAKLDAIHCGRSEVLSAVVRRPAYLFVKEVRGSGRKVARGGKWRQPPLSLPRLPGDSEQDWQAFSSAIVEYIVRKRLNSVEKVQMLYERLLLERPGFCS
jgi:hypothetical protein